ncbi:hypothetical protein KKG58_02795 [Patescibacteria group bacterium]|nr:hypothetical protein [Patescibacteria group bacterium]
MTQKLISMTEKELSRINVIQNLIDGKINGTEGLIHKSRGRTSNRKLDSEIVKKVEQHLKCLQKGTSSKASDVFKRGRRLQKGTAPLLDYPLSYCVLAVFVWRNPWRSDLHRASATVCPSQSKKTRKASRDPLSIRMTNGLFGYSVSKNRQGRTLSTKETKKQLFKSRCQKIFIDQI